MNLFIDTNIILEIILGQHHDKEARSLLPTTHRHQFFLSDFSLHSIGVILFRRNQPDAFLDFCSDMVEPGRLAIIGLSVQHMSLVVQASKQFRLDFDDAYQYVTADKHNLIIVSFDADFDRTERGRKTPQTVLQT